MRDWPELAELNQVRSPERMGPGAPVHLQRRGREVRMGGGDCVSGQKDGEFTPAGRRQESGHISSSVTWGSLGLQCVM